MPELLRCDGLSKQYGAHQVLSSVSFSLNPGEILGIIGPNGSGKTTLMECMAGLLPTDRGTIFWKENRLPPKRSGQFLFYLPDGIVPYADQSVETTVQLFRKMYGAKKTRLEQLIERLELHSMMKKPVRSLSKGYRRRVLLLIGLLSPQPLLMLDEPFDGFDLRQTLGVMDLLRETLDDRTLLLSLHQLTEAEKICDRFLLLNRGRVSAIGTLAQLRNQSGRNTGGLEEVFLAIV